jgi:hypothetical protein
MAATCSACFEPVRIDTLDIPFNTGLNDCHARHAGIQHARGDPVFIVDGDLELDPSVTPVSVRDTPCMPRWAGSDYLGDRQRAAQGAMSC